MGDLKKYTIWKNVQFENGPFKMDHVKMNHLKTDHLKMNHLTMYHFQSKTAAYVTVSSHRSYGRVMPQGLFGDGSSFLERNNSCSVIWVHSSWSSHRGESFCHARSCLTLLSSQ